MEEVVQKIIFFNSAPSNYKLSNIFIILKNINIPIDEKLKFLNQIKGNKEFIIRKKIIEDFKAELVYKKKTDVERHAQNKEKILNEIDPELYKELAKSKKNILDLIDFTKKEKQIKTKEEDLMDFSNDSDMESNEIGEDSEAEVEDGEMEELEGPQVENAEEVVGIEEPDEIEAEEPGGYDSEDEFSE